MADSDSRRGATAGSRSADRLSPPEALAQLAPPNQAQRMRSITKPVAMPSLDEFHLERRQKSVRAARWASRSRWIADRWAWIVASHCNPIVQLCSSSASSTCCIWRSHSSLSRSCDEVKGVREGKLRRSSEARCMRDVFHQLESLQARLKA